MICDDATRNFGARPGYDLHDCIDLDGWNDASIWGYDHGNGGFYAQLWINPGDNDDPDIWLSGVDPHYPWPDCIALAVHEATGRDPVSVIRALGLADPQPALRADHDLHQALHAATAPSTDPRVDSYQAAGQLAVDQPWFR